MSNKEHPSIRVVAPPGGRTGNIFGVPEPEAPMPTKKNHMESDIFGCKSNTESVPVKTTRTTITNNIFGSPAEQPAPKQSVYSDKNRSRIFDEAPPVQPISKPDRQRSTIFAPEEPVQSTPARPVSEKFKSSIFDSADSDSQTKRQLGARQGLRVGYNPINGEPYGTNNDGLNSKVEQLTIVDNENESQQQSTTPSEENGHDKPDEKPTENGHGETSIEKQTNGHSNGHTNGHAAKTSHTSVRIAHPPGGRSNGPLW